MTDHTPSRQPYEPPEGMFMMTPEQAALFNDATRNDLMTLLAQRPATNKQLSEALGRPKGTIGHHLKVLEEAGLIAVVRTRQVRAITEKYYGRVARTYVFPNLDEGGEPDHGFFSEMMGELREPREPEASMFTLRHARIPDERAEEFALEILRIAEQFAETTAGGDTVYGLVAGIYPTDRPSLKEDDE